MQIHFYLSYRQIEALLFIITITEQQCCKSCNFSLHEYSQTGDVNAATVLFMVTSAAALEQWLLCSVLGAISTSRLPYLSGQSCRISILSLSPFYKI